MIDNTYQYYAFVSYRSTDEKWAKWVQQQIEAYRLPAVLQSQRKDLPKGQLRPLFRYHTDIQPNELKTELHNKLEQSKYLLVICSPQSAQSQWVGAEIEGFIQMGRRENIIPIIVAGRPYSDDENECFHPILKKYFPHSDNIEEDHEILGVNLHEEGSGSAYMKRQRAIMQVVSRMLDVNYDQLWQRRRRQLIRRITLSVLGALLVLAALIGVAVMSRPVDVSMTVVPTDAVNVNLPANWQAEVVLHLEREDVPLSLTSDNATGYYYDIPATMMGREVAVSLSARDYLSLDTTLTLSENLTLPLRRNADVYGLLRGRLVRDGRVMPDETLEIDGHEVTTDERGYFELHLPLCEQKTSYPIRARWTLESDSLYAPCGEDDILY